MGYFLASKSFGVPQTTLEPNTSIFSTQEEDEMANYLIDMENRLFGVTTTDLKSLAYQLAVEENKQYSFNVNNEQAGKDWLLGFIKRHSEVSIRKPESTSSARAASFNKVAVDHFFKSLDKVYEDKNFLEIEFTTQMQRTFLSSQKANVKSLQEWEENKLGHYLQQKEGQL